MCVVATSQPTFEIGGGVGHSFPPLLVEECHCLREAVGGDVRCG